MRRILALMVPLILALPAEGGDYFLKDVRLYFPVPVNRLIQAGLKSTKDVREATSTKEKIRRLSSKTGLKVESLRRVREFCRLLQIPGIGPKIVKVLDLAGIHTVEDLAKTNSKSLDKKIREINNKRHILGKIPGQDLLEFWISEAGRLVETKRSGRSGPPASQHHPVR